MLPGSVMRWLVGGLLVAGAGLAALWASGPSGPQPALPAAAWVNPAMPESAAGDQVAAYLQAFNSGDQEELSRFVRAQFTPEGPGGAALDDRLRSQQRFYYASRGLNVFQAKEVSSTEVEILAQLRLTEQWRKMNFMLESDAPHRISGVRIVPVEAPPAIPQGKQQLQPALQAYLERLIDADQFSGVVAVARDGQVQFAKAYGMADQQQGVANTLDTPFHYASVGKMFTAVAIGQLAERGRLSFSDALDQHLPDYPVDAARQITLDHLLTHRSGIVDYFEARERLNNVRDSDNPQQDYWSVFANEPLRFTPGERFEYSNSNYILLASIVERISGQRFEDYLAEHIFQPAGMKATTLDPAGCSVVSPARGYTELDENQKATPGQRRLNQAFALGRGGGAGGGVTTAGDMIKFAEALRAHRLCSAATTTELLKPQVDSPRPGEHYGRGFISRDARRGQIVGHSGGYPGVDAQVDLYEDGWTVVVLANYEAVGEPVARHIEKLLAASGD